MSQTLINLLAPAYAALLGENCPVSEAVTYEQPPLDPFTLRVIFDAPGPLEDADPAYKRCLARLSDFPQTPANGDLLTVAGVFYAVQKVRPDGTGGVYLTINQTSRDPNA